MFGEGNSPVSAPERPLVDPFGRAITYLRVSVTDRCDFRCVYCMAEDMTFLPKNEVLSLEEIDRIASAFIRRGTRKLRLTGGEPLVRRGIIDLVNSLGRHLKTGALEELTLTSNGSQMARHAEALFAAGVRRVNISIDTLDAEKFARITRWGRLPQVLDGIAAATAAGLKVKLNTVALAHENADEIEALMQFAAAGGHDLTLIETMPLGEIGEDRVDQYLPLSRVRHDLAQRYTLTDLPHRTGGPARYVHVEELGLQLGFITPLTHNFCESCNRVRLTATGQLFMCLGQEDQADLKSVIRRTGTDDAAIDAALDEAISRKPKGHDFVIDRRGARPAVARYMSLTGG
ncbi:GTP 3',8-cyclase MoaA [Sandarakinorhabdus limnophila]|jgi:cyclic pyranopterin phosphate synthase|uniref:GTP 3',8-cyclase MoaA n=1 Tax=Sandarakinorhabdus limnophila TaxID=210512 RepID=UPI0026EE42E2|nr:GTP 3',8-cyclase MoaA [Sandarakinorhabdus limnophila]